MKKLFLPLNKDLTSKLVAGEEIIVSGPLLMARDAAHKRLVDEFKKKGSFPINLKNEIIYFAGPTPARKDGSIGSCGPTTSFRMDAFSPVLIDSGLLGMIGKGRRGRTVKESIRKNKALYFVAPAGAGAYLAKKIIKREIILYKDLGPEAVYRIWVKDFPVIVAIDSKGNDIYEKR